MASSVPQTPSARFGHISARPGRKRVCGYTKAHAGNGRGYTCRDWSCLPGAATGVADARWSVNQ